MPSHPYGEPDACGHCHGTGKVQDPTICTGPGDDCQCYGCEEDRADQYWEDYFADLAMDAARER